MLQANAPAATAKPTTFLEQLQALQTTRTQDADKAIYLSKNQQFLKYAGYSLRDLIGAVSKDLNVVPTDANVTDMLLKNGDTMPCFTIQCNEGSFTFKLSKTLTEMYDNNELTPEYLYVDCQAIKVWSNVNEQGNPEPGAVEMLVIGKPGSTGVTVVKRGTPNE